jgi:hypothetical protein
MPERERRRTVDRQRVLTIHEGLSKHYLFSSSTAAVNGMHSGNGAAGGIGYGSFGKIDIPLIDPYPPCNDRLL